MHAIAAILAGTAQPSTDPGDSAVHVLEILVPVLTAAVGALSVRLLTLRQDRKRTDAATLLDTSTAAGQQASAYAGLVDQLQEENARLAERLTRLEGTVATLERQLDSGRTETAALRAQLGSALRERDLARTERDALHSENVQLSARIAHLEERLAVIEARADHQREQF